MLFRSSPSPFPTTRGLLIYAQLQANARYGMDRGDPDRWGYARTGWDTEIYGLKFVNERGQRWENLRQFRDVVENAVETHWNRFLNVHENNAKGFTRGSVFALDGANIHIRIWIDKELSVIAWLGDRSDWDAQYLRMLPNARYYHGPKLPDFTFKPVDRKAPTEAPHEYQEYERPSAPTINQKYGYKMLRKR